MAIGHGFGLWMTSVASMRHTLCSILPNCSTAVTHIPQDTLETPLEHQEAVLGPTDQHCAYKRFGLMGLIVVGPGASMPYGLHLWQHYQKHESTDDAYVAGALIPVSARVQGTVVAVHVEDHQQVEAGQILAHLAPRDFEIRVKQAEVAVEVAAARLHREEIEVSMTQDSTRSSTARAAATVRAVHSALQEAQQRVAQAQLQQAQAELAAAQLQLDDTTLRAPIAGVVTKKRLEPGQAVQAGRPVLTIVRRAVCSRQAYLVPRRGNG
jgi:multidrug resistance efflux pump